MPASLPNECYTNSISDCIATGLTKVPIDGQPPSIVQELDDMARQYIKGDNAIILAVTPANADLATSDALRMARDVDPSGDRTIGEWLQQPQSTTQTLHARMNTR